MCGVHVQVNLFVSAVGDGTLARDTPPKALQRLDQILKKVLAGPPPLPSCTFVRAAVRRCTTFTLSLPHCAAATTV